MRKTIFIKIFLGYLLIITLMTVSVSILTYRIIKQQHIETLTQHLESLAVSAGHGISRLHAQRDRQALETLVTQLGPETGTRVTLIDTDGTVLADSEKNPADMENHGSRLEVRSALEGQTGFSQRYSTTIEADMLYVAVPLVRSGAVEGIVRVSRRVSDMRGWLRQLQIQIGQTALLVVLLAIACALFVARKISAPIAQLGLAARTIAAGDFSARVVVDSRDEVQEFAESFNHMAVKIRELFDEVSLKQGELKSIITSLHEGLLVIDHSGRVLMCNESLARMAGFPPADAPGRYYWELLRVVQLEEIVEASRSSGGSTLHEVRLEGRTCLVNASVIAELDALVMTFLDITEVKNMERMKRDFVVNVSHELRTPLTAIKGFVETLQEESGDSAHQRYLEIISRHTDRLINIVKDLMVLSSLEHEQELELEEVNVKGIAEQVKKIYVERLQEKNLSLNIEAENGRLNAVVDPFRLEQVFINLIDNAIKYTETGGITVQLERVQAGLVIRVADTGIGIAPMHLPKLFERFYVVDKSRSRRVGGTGLGLSIVKHIVLLHKGTIAVASTPGSGTTFTITLPDKA
ncbi:MAG: HAMP domain-containing protein [Deltaproteobacteria bacterium]|nr:HAMP domain-containing protein [Deltaproteobacteria bacterium]